MSAIHDSMMLDFSWEWIEADGISAAEHSATFARLEVKVGGDHVTLVEDRQNRSSRRAINVSLYPLAEWIAFNWWFLQADARTNHAKLGVDARHSLRESGDGFLWPDLTIVPEGRFARVAWFRDREFNPSATLRYLSQGEARINSVELQFVLAGFVSSVIERLHEFDIGSTPLQEEWSAMKALDDEEREYCLASARLGLDPFADGVKHESDILKAAAALPPEILKSFFDAVEPDNIPSSIEWVTQSVSESAAHSGQTDPAILSARKRLQNAPSPRYDEPWRVGWYQAAIVREALGLGSNERFDLNQFVASSVRPIGERRIKAAGAAGASPSSLVVIGNSYPKNALRFTLARAFWHIIATESRSFLVTSSHTESQKIERAFAAELLAPARGIADSIGPLDSVEDEDLEAVADAYDVATTVVEHQVRNQLIGSR